MNGDDANVPPVPPVTPPEPTKLGLWAKFKAWEKTQDTWVKLVFMATLAVASAVAAKYNPNLVPLIPSPLTLAKVDKTDSTTPTVVGATVPGMPCKQCCKCKPVCVCETCKCCPCEDGVWEKGCNCKNGTVTDTTSRKDGHKFFGKVIRNRLVAHLTKDGFAFVGGNPKPLDELEAWKLVNKLDDQAIVAAAEQTKSVPTGSLLDKLGNAMQWIVDHKEAIMQVIKFLMTLLSMLAVADAPPG